MSLQSWFDEGRKICLKSKMKIFACAFLFVWTGLGTFVDNVIAYGEVIRSPILNPIRTEAAITT